MGLNVSFNAFLPKAVSLDGIFGRALGLAFMAIVSGCAPGATPGQAAASGSDLDANSKIIGGHLVKQGDPFQKSIVAIYNREKRYLCSGSLLPNNIVLTAAHCVEPNASAHFIVFGTYAFSMGDQLKTPQQRLQFVRHATATVRHPEYGKPTKNPEAPASDLGLIKFEGTVPPGFVPATLAPSPTATSDLIKPGLKVVVAGYGVQSDMLVEVAFANTPEFKKSLADGDVYCDPDKETKALRCFTNQAENSGSLKMTMLPITKRINASEVELSQDQGSAVCMGDSGGPAYVPTADKKLLLFGVLSTVTTGCNGTSYYTDITTQRKWLDAAIAQLSTTPSVEGPVVAAHPAADESVTYGSFKKFR